MDSAQKQWLMNKLVSNYKWLMEEVEKELQELDCTDDVDEMERIIYKTEWTLQEFLKSNKNNLADLKHIKEEVRRATSLESSPNE